MVPPRSRIFAVLKDFVLLLPSFFAAGKGSWGQPFLAAAGFSAGVRLRLRGSELLHSSFFDGCEGFIRLGS